MVQISEADLTAMWAEILTEDKYRHRIYEIGDLYPVQQALYVDFSDIEQDLDFSEELISKPNKVIAAGEAAILELLHPEQRPRVDRIHLRIRGIPNRIKISELREEHIGKLIVVSGIITKSTFVKFQLIEGIFECKRCHHVITQIQEPSKFVEPMECYKEQGGCGSSAGRTKFRLFDRASKYKNYQKIELQENTDETKSGIQPQRIIAKVYDELAGDIAPGDRIVLTSILLTQQKITKPSSSPIFERYLRANAIEFEEKAYEDIEITPAEEQRILELKDQSNLYENVIASIAPSIYGLRDLKEALALYLFGGIPKILPDGIRERGDIHVFLCGDPGTAKSTLLHRIKEISPRAVFSSGKASTAAGLVAGAVKDEFAEGRWTLEAGTLVLAHGGHAIIDEFDKMDPKHWDIFNEAMEQQKTTTSKVGIQVTLKSECGVLFAANPKKGRIESEDPITDQLPGNTPLLSRFDLIFIVTDDPDQEEDERKADHILKNLIGGQAATLREKKGSSAAPDLVQLEASHNIPFETEFFTKYIAYARRNYFPVMGDEAEEMIKDCWLKIRRQSAGGKVSITARQLQAMVRLAEASARLHMRDEIVKEDAIRMIEIYQNYLIAVSDGDIDIIEGRFNHDQRARLKILLGIVKDLAGEIGNPSQDDICAAAEGRGITRSQTISTLKHLREDSKILLIGRHHYRPIEA